jgi:hypothetical protein
MSIKSVKEEEPEKIEANEVLIVPSEDSLNEVFDTETSLLTCLQFLLRAHGIEKSIASVRDSADSSSEEFDIKRAVSTLRNL